MLIKIRRVQKKDFARISDMRHQLWRIHAVKSKYIDGKVLDAYDAHKNIGANSENKVLVAEVDGKIVGYALFAIRKSEDFFKFKRHVYFDELFVDKNYRRKGIGKKLMDAVVKISRRKKLPILGRIYPFSKESLRLYRKIGGRMLYGTFIALR